MTKPFGKIARAHYGAILADPPWRFETWSERGKGRAADNHYRTMDLRTLMRLPVGALAADDCVLFLWTTWPSLTSALRVIDAWGFTYKTCAFSWLKLCGDGVTPFTGLGYWTRANTEACLLATRGKPKRRHADVRQAIIAPRRQHSRKPDCVHDRIERLVGGPYLELFARARRPGWDCWGHEIDKFSSGPRGQEAAADQRIIETQRPHVGGGTLISVGEV